MLKLSNPELAFVLGRLLLGVNFLMHLLVRLPKLAGFRAGLVKQFAATPLPAPLVNAFASVLPFVEGGIGLLLLLGLFTRPMLVAAMLVMMSLIVGSSLLEEWAIVGSQMLYGLFIFALILYCQHNRLCFDRRPSPLAPA
ncbi:DoxX family membrane protein [Hymenobacter psychrophilus]|uniref:Thiosulfate dehydrogenase [quinone] large subunit n=1 Tax=Hymenobacter psychrophilus TaxID=651662 RepID=A0A1H3IIP7_9BACT|nr:DoxX family membrane protein [Hymenobacter psychrophilus]SDY27457.1 thiosulfate dehydrogenase [quinone] large subunit [Hymenobacter psychrophilus]